MIKLEPSVETDFVYNKNFTLFTNQKNSLTLGKDHLYKLINKWENQQKNRIKRVGGFSLLAISLSACNNNNNYSQGDLDTVKKAALTSSDGTTYSNVDEAILSNDTLIKNSTLTDSSGTVYTSVDAAITSNDTNAINAAVSASTAFNSLSELVSAYVALTDPSTIKLSTQSSDTFTLSLDNDTIDASTRNSLQTGDNISDDSAADFDILSANVTADNQAPTLVNIETLKINGDFLVTGLALTNVTGANSLDLTTSLPGGTATVTNASTSSIAKINASTNVSTLDVTSLSSGTGSTGVIVNGANATTVNVNGGSGVDVFNVTVGDGTSLNLGPVGNFASADKVNVFLDGEVTITTAVPMGTLKISSGTNSSVTAVTSLGTVTDFIGSGDITLSTTGAIADTATSVSSSGTGTLTLNLTNVSNNNVSTVAADTINHMHAGGAGLTIDDSSVLNLDVALATSNMNLAAPGTMIMNVSETQSSRIITGSNVIALTISATPDEKSDTQNGAAITMSDLSLNAATKNVAIIGSDSLTLTDLSTGAATTVSATSMTGDLTISEMGANSTSLFLGSGKNSITTGNVAASFTVVGADGEDTVNLTGSNVLASSVNSFGGNDTITGGSGIDTIMTGIGNDVVNGGPGADVITLGSGNDNVILVGGQDGDEIKDFVLGSDTLILTGSAGGNLNLASQTAISGTYNLDNAGTFDVTLIGSLATDLSNSVQLGYKTVVGAGAGQAAELVTYSPLVSGSWNIISGDKNDVISTAVNSGRTIKTGQGNDTIISSAAASGNVIISDFDVSKDTIILTGAAGDKDSIDLSSISVTSGQYSFSSNHIMNLSNNGSSLTLTDLSSSVQLGNSTTYFSLNDATGSTTVQGGKHNDFIELADGGNTDTVFFIDNGGVDTIISFTKNEDKLNFDSITGISANGINFSATDSKVSDAVNGEVYIFAHQNLTGVNVTFDFNGLNNDASLGSNEVLQSASSYLESSITEANGEKYVALINTGSSDIFAAYLVMADNDGIDSDDLTLIGSVDSNAVINSSDIV